MKTIGKIQTEEEKEEEGTNCSSDYTDDAMCIECTEFYSESTYFRRKKWIQCSSCKIWSLLKVCRRKFTFLRVLELFIRL